MGPERFNVYQQATKAVLGLDIDEPIPVMRRYKSRQMNQSNRGRGSSVRGSRGRGSYMRGQPRVMSFIPPRMPTPSTHINLRYPTDPTQLPTVRQTTFPPRMQMDNSNMQGFYNMHFPQMSYSNSVQQTPSMHMPHMYQSQHAVTAGRAPSNFVPATQTIPKVSDPPRVVNTQEEEMTFEFAPPSDANFCTRGLAG